MLWYFVRHGEIESNRRRIYSGRSHEGLTAKGREQAREAGRRLQGETVGQLFCSPLVRALETAALIGGYLDLEPRAADCFTELDYGRWAGLSEKTVAANWPEEWRLWNTRPAELDFPGRETVAAMHRRVLEGMEKIAGLHPDTAGIVVVTHVAVIRAVLMNRDRRDLNSYRFIPVDNAEIFRVDHQELQLY